MEAASGVLPVIRAICPAVTSPRLSRMLRISRFDSLNGCLFSCSSSTNTLHGHLQYFLCSGGHLVFSLVSVVGEQFLAGHVSQFFYVEIGGAFFSKSLEDVLVG